MTKINNIKKEISRLAKLFNRTAAQEITCLQEEAAWALYESNAVQDEIAATRAAFRVEEEAAAILEAQGIQKAVDDTVSKLQVKKAEAQKAALETVITTWNKATAHAKWVRMLADVDHVKCAVVNAAAATFMLYIKALMRGYFWAKAQISAVIDAATDVAADLEAELQLRWMRSQMADFVYDGQLFGADKTMFNFKALQELHKDDPDVQTAPIGGKGIDDSVHEHDVVNKTFILHKAPRDLARRVMQNPQYFEAQLNVELEMPDFDSEGYLADMPIDWLGFSTPMHRYNFERAMAIAQWTPLSKIEAWENQSESEAEKMGFIFDLQEHAEPKDEWLAHKFCVYCGKQGCDSDDEEGNPYHLKCHIDILHKILESEDGNRKFRFYRDADIEVDDPYGLEDDHFSELCGITENNTNLLLIHWDGTKHQQYIQCRVNDGTCWWMDLSDKQLNKLLNQFQNDNGHIWNIETFGYAEWKDLDERYESSHTLKEYLDVLVDDAAQAEINTEETASVSNETKTVFDKDDDVSVAATNTAETATEVIEEVRRNKREEIKMTNNKIKKMAKKMFAMTKITFVECKESTLGFLPYITESQGELTDATAPFVREQVFRAATESLQKTKLSSTQIVELEAMFDELRETQAKVCMADIAVFRGSKTVDVYYRPQEAFIGKQSGELKLRAADYWVKLTGKISYDAEAGKFSFDEIVNEIPKTARIFSVWQRVNTTSQGRKNLMYAFSTTQAKFDRIRDEVTCGMTTKYYGRRVNLKYNADFTTRASSHDTHVISNMLVDSYVILFGKKDDVDGNGILNAGYLADGELDKQVRPYSTKGFCTIWPADAVVDFVATKSLKVLVRNEISAEDEQMLDAMLTKDADKTAAKKYFAGFDGVQIQADHNSVVPMLIGDQNFFKAAFDYNRVDGLHVLAEADHDEDLQNLSTQLSKIILQAGAESNHYDEALSILTEYAVNHINSYFDKAKDPIRVLSWNSNLIQEGMPLSVAAGTLGWDVTKYPQLMKQVLKDKLTRLGRNITRVNFGIEGKYLPAEPDVAAWFDLSVLKTTADYVEVYVPGMTGYALLLKYPSTGSNEYVIVKFLTLDEINARINALETDDLRKSIIRRVYASIKSGVCVISSDEVVRRMLAGFDFDGDHVLLVLDQNFVEFMMKNGHPIAVYIETPDDGTDEDIILSSASFAAHAYRMAKTGNKAVGQVVNLGRFFTNSMTALMAHATTRDQREVMHGVMQNVLFNKNTFHGIDYKSPFIRDEVNGIQTVKLNRTMVNNMISAAKHIRLTRKNVLAWLRDMDHAFRFYSELTIDAQKNLYEVAIKFAKYMKKQGYRISSNVCALDFAMNMNADGTISNIDIADDRILMDAVPNKKGQLKWLGDIMTPVRRAAAETVMERSNEMISEYNDILADTEAKRILKQDEFIAKNDELFAAVNLLGRYSSALVRMARIALKNERIGRGQIPQNILRKLQDMAKDRVKADFLGANDSMTNMYRRVAGEYTAEELVERIMAVSRGDRMLSDICHEEILKFFLDKENVQYRRKIRLYDGISIGDVEDMVVVLDGKIENIGSVGHDVEDGMYDTVIEDGYAYIMQMASERITVPVANSKEFMVLFEGNPAKAAEKYLKENDEACFVARKDGYVNMRTADNAEQVAIVVTNSFASDDRPLMSSALYRDLVNNKKVNVIGYKKIDAEYDKNGHETHKMQLILICEEIGEAPAMPENNTDSIVDCDAADLAIFDDWNC